MRNQAMTAGAGGRIVNPYVAAGNEASREERIPRHGNGRAEGRRIQTWSLMFEGCDRLMSLAPVSGPVSSGFTEIWLPYLRLT
jgi:hypothetical protein